MAKLYAVLVGINGYPLSPLQGCINDVDAVETYLNTVYRKEDVAIKRLTDNDQLLPTRSNLIQAFDHFQQAEAGDVCLFYYSGHGSFSAAPEEFWTDTTGLVQSFVLQDSRLPGGRDLLDKELGYLIWKTMVKKDDVTFVAITDCCHAGTITKALFDHSEIVDKMEKPNPVPVSIKEYLGYGETIDGIHAYAETLDAVTNRKRITGAQGSHIHIASSRDNQTSKELVIEGKRRSAFTFAMLNVLYACSGNISYKELVDKAAIQVKNIVPQQFPLINWNGDIRKQRPDIDKKTFLLHENIDNTASRFRVYFDGQYGKWCLSAGRLQNITDGDLIKTTEGYESIVLPSPYPDFSFVQRHNDFEINKEYACVILRTTDKITPVSVAEDVPQTIKQLLLTTAWTSGLFFIQEDMPGKFIIRKNEFNQYYLSLPGSNAPLNSPQDISTAIDVSQFFSDIDSVCKWVNLQEFNNPSSRLGPQDYEITFFRETGNGQYEELKERLPVNDLYYKKMGEEWEQPYFRVNIKNIRTKGTLFLSYAYLCFDYGINTAWFESQELAPGKDAWLTFLDDGFATDRIGMQVDAKYIQLGYNEITEYLKIFISTEKIDLDSKSQEGIELPHMREKSLTGLVADKSPSGSKDAPLFGAKDWKTELIGFRIIKPMEEVAISDQHDTDMQGLKILKHDVGGHVTVTGSDKLASVFDYLSNSISFDAKSIGEQPAGFVPAPATANGNSYLAPFDLNKGQSRQGMLNDVLEFTGIQNKQLVTPENPLIIELPVTKSMEDDTIVPVAFDPGSGLYYPVGYFDGQERRIYIEALPDETPNDAAITQKSFFGSIKIYIQKVIGAKLGFVSQYPRLAIATVDDSMNVNYNDKLTDVINAVTAANDIFLFIHGIIGDTESIVKCIRTPLNGDRETLVSQNKAQVLTFDYENLHTSIKQTANDLKTSLAAVGLKEGHTKKLTIVAHSMGGLVSRYFIEQLHGYNAVSRLIMLGTPNNGSHWTNVRDMADTLLTYALNGAVFLKPWMLILSKVLGRVVKDAQNTLQEMGPESDFLKELNSGRSPKIPYVIIAGNTQKIIIHYEETASLIQKLFSRVKKRGIYDALDQLLFKKPNDIAVTADSISTLKAPEEWEHKPVCYEVACDHLNYFVNTDALSLVHKTCREGL